jgi:hypothetical protein
MQPGAGIWMTLQVASGDFDPIPWDCQIVEHSYAAMRPIREMLGLLAAGLESLGQKKKPSD